MQQSSGFFNIDGVSLEYQLFKPAQSLDLTLVLLHEGLGCVAMWKDFPQQLARKTGCRVLTYSRSGYGGSDPCALPRPLLFMHDEGLRVLPKVLTAANIKNAILVGHSDGASIALIGAGGRDERILGVVLMAPHVFVEELTLTSIHAATTTYRSSGLRERLARYHGDNVDCAFLGWSQVWLDQDFQDWTLDAELAKIEVPVLLLQGEQDNYGTIRQLETIAGQLTDLTETIFLPDCGHSVFRDQPTVTLHAITDFLQRLY